MILISAESIQLIARNPGSWPWPPDHARILIDLSVTEAKPTTVLFSRVTTTAHRCYCQHMFRHSKRMINCPRLRPRSTGFADGYKLESGSSSAGPMATLVPETVLRNSLGSYQPTTTGFTQVQNLKNVLQKLVSHEPVMCLAIGNGTVLWK